MVDAVSVEGFSHVAIDVTDLDEALAFYCGVLGFETLQRPDFGFPGAWLRVGTLQLHLAVIPEAPTSTGFPHFALHVPAEAFHETIDALRRADVEFLGQPGSRVDFGTTVWAAFIRDPSGNVIELTDVGPVPA
jgi:catechol 2,3-dioxygenase-like lactoylglutathione lyase family enzyme